MFILILFIIVIVLSVLYITSVINLKKLRTSYAKFMNKLGNGNNVEELIQNYIKKVEIVEREMKKYIHIVKYLIRIWKNVRKKSV